MAMGSFWESCLQRFEQELPVQQFNTWIKPLRLEGEDSPLEGLRLIAPNGFIMKWVRDRYMTRIEDYSRSFFAHPISIALVIDGARAANFRGSPPQLASEATINATPAARFSHALANG